MRVLHVKKEDNKYVAADEVGSVLLNHLLGKEGFHEAERKDVVALAEMHGFIVDIEGLVCEQRNYRKASLSQNQQQVLNGGEGWVKQTPVPELIGEEGMRIKKEERVSYQI